MPKIALAPDALKVYLSGGEKLAALHGSLSIPWNQVRGAEAVDTKFWQHLGLRLPGTGLPGVLIAGTFVWRKDRAFVYWSRGKQALQINLDGNRFGRLVIGVGDAEEMAERINSALAGC
jgi:hypothetical protein